MGAQPKPWSFSALDQFENCPKQYLEERVLKTVPYVEGEEAKWGKYVHKQFENRIVHGSPLVAELAMHEEPLAEFCNAGGTLAGEERIALDFDLMPCKYFGDPRVWYRGQIDARRRNGRLTHILDHKTGKVKNDFRQLKLFAFHEFRANPECEEVRAEYYWTQIRGSQGETYYRHQMWDLMREFLPSLKRFAEAFESGIFTTKPSGLCGGWCGVTTCEYWRPKRPRK